MTNSEFREYCERVLKTFEDMNKRKKSLEDLETDQIKRTFDQLEKLDIKYLDIPKFDFIVTNRIDYEIAKTSKKGKKQVVEKFGEDILKGEIFDAENILREIGLPAKLYGKGVRGGERAGISTILSGHAPANMAQSIGMRMRFDQQIREMYSDDEYKRMAYISREYNNEHNFAEKLSKDSLFRERFIENCSFLGDIYHRYFKVFKPHPENKLYLIEGERDSNEPLESLLKRNKAYEARGVGLFKNLSEIYLDQMKEK